MDQKSSLFKEAKQILNDNGADTYTDSEITEIIALLDIFSNIIYLNLPQNS
ncbi:hypothetical protein [Psychroserpens mesophilus]|uniref:hypothetical protein n=1 Tax=Psychroserpens mesophilus TaxID=325473 RepID=UPI0013642ADC|nr:hypothetical protein [Psychroserpens mesophilus]